MNSRRKTTIIVGLLFIVATAVTMITFIWLGSGSTSGPYRAPPGGFYVFLLLEMAGGLIIWGYVCNVITCALSKHLGVNKIVGLPLMFLWLGPLALFSDATFRVFVGFPGLFSISPWPLIFFTYYAGFAFIGYAYNIIKRKPAWLGLSRRIGVALFFIGCLMVVDLLVVSAVFNRHFIEGLATLLLIEGIPILLLGVMATVGAAPGRLARSSLFYLARTALDDGLSQRYERIERILMLIVGAVLTIGALLLLVLF